MATLRTRALRAMGAALCLAASCAAAQPAIDEATMATLLDEFGKEMLVETLLEARHGQMTVRAGGGYDERWGRQRLDRVDAATLARDAQAAKLDAAALRELLSERQAEDRGKTVVSAGGPEPLAGFPRDFEVEYSQRRSYTVGELLDDARYHCKHWPEELNRLRQSEARRRNRAIEAKLYTINRRHGEGSLSEIARRHNELSRTRIQACRARRRERKGQRPDAAEKMRCDEAHRMQSGAYVRELREEIHDILRDFERAMREHDRVHLPGWKPPKSSRSLRVRRLDRKRDPHCR